jgi:hypothetical protein
MPQSDSDSGAVPSGTPHTQCRLPGKAGALLPDGASVHAVIELDLLANGACRCGPATGHASRQDRRSTIPRFAGPGIDVDEFSCDRRILEQLGDRSLRCSRASSHQARSRWPFGVQASGIPGCTPMRLAGTSAESVRRSFRRARS